MIQIIKRSEKLVTEISGATFTYRRITNSEYKNYTDKHVTKGKVDLNATADEVIADHLYKWDGIVDEFNQTVHFSPELVEFIPDDVKADLLAAIRGSMHVQFSNAEAGGEFDVEKK